MVAALFNRRLAKLADEKGIELPEDMLVIEIFWEEKVMLSNVRRVAQDYEYLSTSRWWFQIFFIFHPTWGNDPIWLIFFKWVETTNQIYMKYTTRSYWPLKCGSSLTKTCLTGRRRSLRLPCGFVRHGPDEKGGWNWRGFQRLEPRPWEQENHWPKPPMFGGKKPLGFGGVLCFFCEKKTCNKTSSRGFLVFICCCVKTHKFHVVGDHIDSNPWRSKWKYLWTWCAPWWTCNPTVMSSKKSLKELVDWRKSAAPCLHVTYCDFLIYINFLH